jgi:hypothetical protein
LDSAVDIDSVVTRYAAFGLPIIDGIGNSFRRGSWGEIVKITGGELFFRRFSIRRGDFFITSNAHFVLFSSDLYTNTSDSMTRQ